jgi:hypothetical protein
MRAKSTGYRSAGGPGSKFTQIAISFATADSNFTDQLENMLEHISYIDECDTLGQKAEEKKIHKVKSQHLLQQV